MLSRENLTHGLLPLVARLLLSAEFLIAVNGKITDWSGQAGYMAAHGMTMIAPLLGAALVIELVGSLALITGFQARNAAAVMFVYLGIVSVRLHDFWNIADPMAADDVAIDFPRLSIILAHAGRPLYMPTALFLARRHENVQRIEMQHARRLGGCDTFDTEAAALVDDAGDAHRERRSTRPDDPQRGRAHARLGRTGRRRVIARCHRWCHNDAARRSKSSYTIVNRD